MANYWDGTTNSITSVASKSKYSLNFSYFFASSPASNSLSLLNTARIAIENPFPLSEKFAP
uniref:Uncharacterized protein n=1 Tax=Cannabis sativa TaxID=3483 RepID=A0A803QT07_CANSA